MASARRPPRGGVDCAKGARRNDLEQSRGGADAEAAAAADAEAATAAAGEVRSGKGSPTESPTASSLARDPPHQLRAVDLAGGEGLSPWPSAR